MVFIYNPNTHYPIGETAHKYGSGVKIIVSRNRRIVTTPNGVNIDVFYSDILPQLVL